MSNKGRTPGPVPRSAVFEILETASRQVEQILPGSTRHGTAGAATVEVSILEGGN